MQAIKDGQLIEVLSPDDYVYITDPAYLEHPLGSDSHQTDGQKLLSTTDQWERSLAVMHNSIARSVTQMTLEQRKLFILALSKIPYRTEDGYVKLPKKTVRELLGVQAKNDKWFRELVRQTATASWVQLPASEKEYKDGFLITTSKPDRWNIYIAFNPQFLPLLEHLSKQFTSVYVASILPFKSKSSFSFYLYMLSWIDRHYLTGDRIIYKNDLPRAFGLSDTDYWVTDTRTKKKIFSWANFEKKCMLPVFREIKENKNTEFKIEGFQKIRDGKFIKGYRIFYRVIHPDMLEINQRKRKELLTDTENIVYSEDF